MNMFSLHLQVSLSTYQAKLCHDRVFIHIVIQGGKAI